MNSMKAILIPQLMSAKRRAGRLVQLGRISELDAFLFCSSADKMIAQVEEMEEEEVLYGQTGSHQAHQ